MWKTILRRVVLMIPQIVILSILVFILAKLMPGDPFAGNFNPNVTPEILAELKEKAGLNDPWPTQYARWITNIFHGDLGRSFIYKLDVTTILGQRIPNTISLSLLTSIITYLIALPLGMLAGRYEDSWLDRIIGVYSYLTFAIPVFIFGLLMLFLFGYKLQWFPTGGSVDIGVAAGFPTILNKFYHLLLPALTQAILATAVTIQYLRTSVIDSKKLDFVRTARSKGVPSNKVYTRHIFRNASLPIASTLGFEISSLIAGSVIIENIFGFPGIGQLFISSIGQRDYAVITALILILGIVTLVGMLISDIVMSIVDPRIRIQ
ncbi:peptide/nickel transport system permease protein [Pilibacter termitis]|uniref:Peptide/nickel transport system permease protein n=1 Tax=Pilibacter termitis TaxID=263852 RepID=A0A1T4P869_9ENTE|nr:oligopeptide ABC transporter permease [Pilibacter termitis]SJZ87517.1 peptide/nickel transport system permease protein [Pilibacter termitis]